MTLQGDAARARSEFESMDTDSFLDILVRVREELRTEETRQYLDRKIDAARGADPAGRRDMCRALLPYLDWYLSGR